MKNLQNPWWWASLAATICLVILGVPFLLVVVPVLHWVRNLPKRLVKAEYRHRQRTRNWDDY